MKTHKEREVGLDKFVVLPPTPSQITITCLYAQQTNRQTNTHQEAGIKQQG